MNGLDIIFSSTARHGKYQDSSQDSLTLSQMSDSFGVPAGCIKATPMLWTNTECSHGLCFVRLTKEYQQIPFDRR